jgi:hypothetical protein
MHRRDVLWPRAAGDDQQLGSEWNRDITVGGLRMPMGGSLTEITKMTTDRGFQSASGVPDECASLQSKKESA